MTEWRQVTYKGIELPYEVSRRGIIRRIAGPDCVGRMRKRKTITPHIICGGYLQVILQNKKRRYSPLVHTIVAFAFLAPPPGEYGRGKIAINHKNGKKTDNRPSNLEWVTYQQNSDHASYIGLMRTGERNHASVLREKDIPKIRKDIANGITRAELARQYKCSYCAIDSIFRGITWRHVS
jgi:hypothetical protein